MELKDIASISGKSGLFRIVAPTKSGALLESLDSEKKRFIAGIQTKVSILSDVSMYTKTEEGSVTLQQILKAIYVKFGAQIPVSASSDGASLHQFMLEVLPDYDQDKVYQSDIKKLINWYGVLTQMAPEIFEHTDNHAESTSVD